MINTNYFLGGIYNMSMINKKLEDFKVQAYQDGEFKEVTQDDVKGKWSVFFF